ncbi:hypothetical protein [Phytohalomonas tamaricis]|uniref:hypothetical protein n=1 Tax=Phytohalomonas tamaricis TaxID=2081032 RepID=UPI000D0ABA05|nr:hypothetical protein [Phytohalomonas tamaricis]
MEMFTGLALTPLPLAWEDSANWLWKSEGVSPELIKLARMRPEQDAFWHGLSSLFGFDRWRIAERIPHLAGALPPLLPLMPLPMTYLGQLQHCPVWSLPWRTASVAHWTTTFAELLGDHVGRLHREAVSGWGHPLERTFALDQWPLRVKRYLSCSTRRTELGSLADRLPAVPTRAVWSLPDLRVDQFMWNATGWFWNDWEALLWAPLEFDWSLFELLLDNEIHRAAFYEAYRLHASPPDVQQHRFHCRAVLWLMNVFGPLNWETLASRPCWVDSLKRH